MIEDMYKEEFGDAEIEPKSSPEHAATSQDINSAFDERRDEFLGNLTSEDNHRTQSYLMRPDVISSTQIDASRADLDYQAGPFQDSEDNFGLAHFPNKQVLNTAGNSIFF